MVWCGAFCKEPNPIVFAKGFAHGYSVLSEKAIVQYKVDSAYNPLAESGIRYNDPDLGIDWQVDNPKLSDKDLKLPFLKDLTHEKGTRHWCQWTVETCLQDAAKTLLSTLFLWIKTRLMLPMLKR